MPDRLRLLALALLVASAVPARAERLFVGLAVSPSPDGRIGRVRTLALDQAALVRLRGSHETTVTEFPLGADGTATLALVRFSPFAPDASAVVMTADGPRPIALPDQRYYRGTVAGDPASRVVLVAAPGAVRGLVATAGTIYRFGPDASGTYRSWALRDAAPDAFASPPTICGNDRFADLVGSAPGHAGLLAGAESAPPPTAGYAPTLQAEVAIETDQELRGHFASATDELAYLADLAAAGSAIYDADTNVRLRFKSIRIWETTDPWVATATDDMLVELRTYWNANEVATPRDTVHFVSGKTVVGGIAYIDVLCNPSYGYGVSTVYGSFDVLDPYLTWDVVVVTHEIGHNFGSEHTHCYVPPLDHCWNHEAGCYSGPVELPPGGGTIMSYCHQLPPGMPNINLTFGATVSGVLRAGAESGVCIGLPCGDGILDPGEDCDDGNDVNGDCCSSTCTLEPDGQACDDGDVCTAPDQCSSGVCTGPPADGTPCDDGDLCTGPDTCTADVCSGPPADGTPCDDGEACTANDLCTADVCAGTPVADGTPCDDGIPCTYDTCQAGSCASAPTPLAGCKRPTAALASQVVLKDKTPSTGDQVVWKWTKGEATDVRDFGDPTAGGDDYDLCLFDASPSIVLASRVPAASTCANGVPCWRAITGRGFLYKDRYGSAHGTQKLQLSAGLQGKAKVTLKAKGSLVGMPALGLFTMPITVQLQRPGQCWEAEYATPLVDTTMQLKAKSVYP